MDKPLSAVCVIRPGGIPGHADVTHRSIWATVQHTGASVAFLSHNLYKYLVLKC